MSGKMGRSGRPRIHDPEDGSVLQLPALESLPDKPHFDSPDASKLWDDVAESLHAKGTFEQGAARFGMNPSDRQKIKEKKPTTPAIAARQRG
jgi:hypothetical protein